jgi:hypothetical protein
MKKIAALALAGLMGASALAMTAGTAAADPWDHHEHHHDWDHHGHGWGGWGWGGPFLLGLGVGTLYSHSYDYGYGGSWGDHVRWCETHYRTYNPRTDTFYIRAGVPARCVAPFDRY